MNRMTLSKDEMLYCKNCEKEFRRGDLAIQHVLQFCPDCGIGHSLMLLKEYLDQERQKKLSKRIYCKNCEYIGLVEEFPFNAPLEDEHREKYCPKCMGDDLINMSNIKMCGNCNERPAANDDAWCTMCSEEVEAAWISKQDANDYGVDSY